MEPQKRRLLFIGGALVLVLGVIVAVFSHHPSQEAYTPGPGFYYTGVRFNHKTGQWVSGDNKVVPPPANVTPQELAKLQANVQSQQNKMKVPQ